MLNTNELFAEELSKIENLHASKDARYGNAYGEVRKKYSNVPVVMLNIKLKRLETLLYDQSLESEESIEDTLRDMASYCIMELVERKLEADEGK